MNQGQVKSPLFQNITETSEGPNQSLSGMSHIISQYQKTNNEYKTLKDLPNSREFSISKPSNFN